MTENFDTVKSKEMLVTSTGYIKLKVKVIHKGQSKSRFSSNKTKSQKNFP